MIVSWNWLKQYVQLDMPVEELSRRLMLAGFNHESTSDVAGDLAIDLEITSNRPDCLGHLGIAREVAVLWERAVKLPAAEPKTTAEPTSQFAQVQIDCLPWCPQYIARVIHGVKIGPSPAWLSRRLHTLGVASINNVVDVTNYVLFECGQPLHAFDLAKLAGQQIIVRAAKAGEKLEAINHKTYDLTPAMCVIADAERPVALAGVMGGASTEVSGTTTDLLIESAEFDPLTIRNTARKLGLRSDSSYRFERGIDSHGLDWASRRCCELILEVAGGHVAAGIVAVGSAPAPRPAVVLRFSQIKRILGIEIPADAVRQILTRLGLTIEQATPEKLEASPPSWRRDLTREIDLIEEVARVHGYEAIPEDVIVPLCPSRRLPQDRILYKLRNTLTALGYDEAMTLSAVDADLNDAFSPWTSAPALRSQIPVLRRADHLRRSLIPSLLAVRRTNESLFNPIIELFEIAKTYWAQPAGLPQEPWMLGLASGADFFAVKGTLETILAALNPELTFETRDLEPNGLLHPEKSAELWLGDLRVAVIGEVSPAGLAKFDLRQPATVAELQLEPLGQQARLIQHYQPLVPYPASTRDLNLVLPEQVRWAELANVVRANAGPHNEELTYRETYRNPQVLGAGKKSLLLTLTFRGKEGTLTTEQIDADCQRIVAAVKSQLSGELRA